MAEPKGLFSMRKIALQSIENGEVILRVQIGRTILDPSLVNKWSNAPLWLLPPGETMMMSQLSFSDT